jgi:hypothetical protein
VAAREGPGERGGGAQGRRKFGIRNQQPRHKGRGAREGCGRCAARAPAAAPNRRPARAAATGRARAARVWRGGRGDVRARGACSPDLNRGGTPCTVPQACASYVASCNHSKGLTGVECGWELLLPLGAAYGRLRASFPPRRRPSLWLQRPCSGAAGSRHACVHPLARPYPPRCICQHRAMATGHQQPPPLLWTQRGAAARQMLGHAYAAQSRTSFCVEQL